ncbi:MAG: AI-2E family transporter [Rickettsiales bacterium]|jgi:predicted PurR-regulated permease PerM|nr:AI-2E family transporter [Rickettsiales bacterium]
MANGIIAFIGLIIILYIGRPIFVPVAVAAFLWYLINAVAAYLRRILPMRESIAAGLVALTGACAIMFGIVVLFVMQIKPAATALIARLPEIQLQLASLQSHFSDWLGVSLNAVALPKLANIGLSLGASIAAIGTAAGMVLIYMLFMFVEQSTFSHKLSAMFPNARKFSKMKFIINSIDSNMKRFMAVKTFTSALDGILAYAWLSWMGLEFAGVWGFLVFILNFIPTFGSWIACAMPIIYAAISFGTLNEVLLVAGGLIGLQLLVGNILDPKLTGDKLNLSTLAILINLVFWGMIWGVAGMFFSVPLLVAIFVITAQFDATRWIAVMLSANGQIPDKNED